MAEKRARVRADYLVEKKDASMVASRAHAKAELMVETRDASMVVY